MAQVSYLGSIIIGIAAGIVLPLSVSILDNKFHVDDPAGAISLHGACGITGTILGGLLSAEDGLLYGFGADRLIAQLIGMTEMCIRDSCSKAAGKIVSRNMRYGSIA